MTHPAGWMGNPAPDRPRVGRPPDGFARHTAGWTLAAARCAITAQTNSCDM